MMKLFKILIPILILFFPSLIFAEDISDFQIEGFSIGESMLDSFSEEEIINFQKIPYNDDTFYDLIAIPANLEIYDVLIFGVKKNDPDYSIFSINAVLIYDNQIENCLSKKKDIVSDIKEIFSKSVIIDEYKDSHHGDKTGNSIFYSTDFNFDSGGNVRVMCLDLTLEFNQGPDHLRVIINSKEYGKWLNSEAYD